MHEKTDEHAPKSHISSSCVSSRSSWLFAAFCKVARRAEKLQCRWSRVWKRSYPHGHPIGGTGVVSRPRIGRGQRGACGPVGGNDVRLTLTVSEAWETPYVISWRMTWNCVWCPPNAPNASRTPERLVPDPTSTSVTVTEPACARAESATPGPLSSSDLDPLDRAPLKATCVKQCHGGKMLLPSGDGSKIETP